EDHPDRDRQQGQQLPQVVSVAQRPADVERAEQRPARPGPVGRVHAAVPHGGVPQAVHPNPADQLDRGDQRGEPRQPDQGGPVLAPGHPAQPAQPRWPPAAGPARFPGSGQRGHGVTPVAAPAPSVSGPGSADAPGSRREPRTSSSSVTGGASQPSGPAAGGRNRASPWARDRPPWAATCAKTGPSWRTTPAGPVSV